MGGGRPVEQVLVSAGRLLLRRVRPEHGCVSGHVVGIEGQNGSVETAALSSRLEEEALVGLLLLIVSEQLPGASS